MSGQLDLFGAPEIAAHVTDEDRALAQSLPAPLRLGTSSWSFPGWAGIVWQGAPREDDLAKRGLEAYAQHPLLRAVSLDRSYYGPVGDADLARYASQIEAAARRAPSLPPFRVVSKVWDEITTAVFPRHARYGARAGAPNPSFLDAARFLAEVVAPYERVFSRHAGPFVFELTPMPRGALGERALCEKVAAFLSRMPSGFRAAFELRNEELLGARWLDTLAAHGASHVYTYWTAMPPIREQLALRPIGAPFVVARLMLPRFARYEDKKAAFAPFDRLVAPQPEMRDDVVRLVLAALEADAEDVTVLVNNKAEGSAPLTVRAIAERVAEALR